MQSAMKVFDIGTIGSPELATKHIKPYSTPIDCRVLLLAPAKTY